MNPYTMYAQNSVQNASPENIMLQLYEGAIIRLNQARELWEQGEKVKAMERRTQAKDIILTKTDHLKRNASFKTLQVHFDVDPM